MTDGSKSHSDFVAPAELSRIRKSEGRAAARALGLRGEDVIPLEYPETELGSHLDSATHCVEEILQKRRPQDVFVPYRLDPLPDHLATHRIVTAALRRAGSEVSLYEYPIWFWQYWPWMNAPRGKVPKRRAIWRHNIRSGFRLLRDFRCRVYIGDVLDAKWSALQQHRSQMTRLNSDPRWPTLGDVSDGEFLECFFQEYEYFSRHVFPGKRVGGETVRIAVRDR